MLLADNTLSAVALAIAVGGTALAVVLGGAAFLLARERTSPSQIRSIVREANAPLEEIVTQLARSLELSRAEWAGAEASSLGDVLERLAAAARRVSGADAAAVVLEREGREPQVVTTGFAPGTRYDPATLRPAGSRGVLVSYRHGEEAADNGSAIRAGLSVPLEAGGAVSVFWRDPPHEPGEPELARLSELAARASPAIDRALR